MSRETTSPPLADAMERRGADTAPVIQAPPGGDAKASPSTAGAVVGSPNASNTLPATPAAGATVGGSRGAGTASTESAGGASSPAGPTSPSKNSAGAKPAGIAAEAGAASRSMGTPSDSQTSTVASVSGQSGGTTQEAAMGAGGTTSMDQATAFGQMVTSAVLAQELNNLGRSGGGNSQVDAPTDKLPLAMNDRTLLAEVGGTTPLDANAGGPGIGGAVNPLGAGGGTVAPSPSPVPSDLPLPAVDAGEIVRQTAELGAAPGVPLSPSISPSAIPEPTLLVQVLVVLAGSALVARRRTRVDAARS